MIYGEIATANIPEEAKRHRKLMIAVLTTQIQDYLYARATTDDIEGERRKLDNEKTLKKNKKPKELRKVALLTRGSLAYAYIFDDSWESENYVFGFVFICRCIGLDPGKFRTAIRKLKMENIPDIWAKAKGK